MLENAAEDPSAGWNGDAPRGSGKRILYLSNLVPEKGCFDLIAALESLGERASGTEVRLVGEADDDVADEVRRRAHALAEKGIHVDLAGAHVGADKERDFQWADVFVLPSRYPPEGQPLVLLEAMAAGLPILSTRHSGIPHTVRDDREGLIVEPGDVTAIAGALERLMNDADLRARLGRAGRERYEAVYTPAAFQRRVAELFA
jgi:glycosyltransferase involved in cell wall biosynthesis